MKRQPTARMRSPFFSLIAMVCCTLSAAHALAQPATRPRVVVVPWVVAGDSATPEQLAKNVANVGKALAEDADIVDPTVARTRILTYGRFPAPHLTQAERAEFQRLVRAAWIAVGRQDIQAGKQAIAQALTFGRERLETLNRDDELARTLLDLCLLTPRVMVDEGASRQLLVLEVMECRKLVPRLAPSEDSHVPEVLAALDEADRIVRSTPPAILQIKGPTDEGCIAFLNGRRIGSVPTNAQLSAGTYFLQVECSEQLEETGFVRTVVLSASKVTSIDIEPYETYLRANDAGVLFAQEVRGLEVNTSSRLLDSLSAIAVNLEVDYVVVVRASATNETKIEVVGRTGPSACGGVAKDAELESKARDTLGCARTERQRVRAEASSGAPSAESFSERTYTSSRGSKATRWGLGLAGAGVGILGAAWVTHYATSDRERGPSDHWIQSVGALGTTLVVVSEPYWMPIGARQAPWWTWAGAALGVAPVAVAALRWRDDAECTRRFTGGGCAAFRNTRTVAGLSMISAVPLLVLPVSHYIARGMWAEAGTTVSSSFEPKSGALSVSLQGSF